ncbi:hypothetical protein [Methylosinus sp. Sm6]|uniref:hypothetical protein n=1 Tax=Methylosinus sp. Sm6 TaxID=2866948 RepID=UPI001C99335F|nr:hypothetical protein [Methylosinus sp. Sm6]MBY6241403.1 hypothetical protein [Methylosinus sp. Sm6]
MVSRRLSSPLRLAFFAISVLSGPQALAAGWHYYDPECPIALGGSKTMKFVAMQPKKNIDRVCDALPDTGPTVIALDAPDAELREMNWDIRVLRDSGSAAGGEPSEADAVLRLPPQKYRNGMVNFDVNIAGAGKYIIYARLYSDDGAKEFVGRRQFTVGLLDNTEFYAYLLFAGLVAAVGGRFAFLRLKKAKAPEPAPPSS